MENPHDIPETTSEMAIAEGKNTAIIAHLTFIGWIIAFIMNNDKKNSFATFHIRQSLGLMCSGLAIAIIAMIPVLGWIIYFVGLILLLIMWFSGLMNAINGKEKPMPLMGKAFEKWLKGLQ